MGTVVAFWGPDDPDADLPETWGHVRAHTVGDSLADAKAAAQEVLDRYARGRKALVRIPPRSWIAEPHQKPAFFCGAVRFSYCKEPGEWFAPEEAPTVTYFGAA
jgi:hypothetical protein